MFPTAHSRMALKREPLLAWRRKDGGGGLVEGDGAPLRAQGRRSVSRSPGQGGQVGACWADSQKTPSRASAGGPVPCY